MALISLKYQHVSPSTLDNLHDSYATQLQKLNLWHWSIFILLHVADERRREKTIKFYLSQNCTSSIVFDDKEKFLSEVMSIPNQWLYDAKALRAKYERLHENEAYLLIKASRWNQAHSIILDLIAPTHLINKNYSNLIKYLEPLAQNVEHIHKWHSGGKIYMDFLKLEETFKYLELNVRFKF
jgi:nuclear pore complex protein Nup98-Nup96